MLPEPQAIQTVETGPPLQKLDALLGCLCCCTSDADEALCLNLQPLCNMVQVLIATALHSGGLASKEVGYMAVHGTGTPLGDPIEVGALAGALGGNPAQPKAITLGSVKASLDAGCGDSYTPAVCSIGCLIKVTARRLATATLKAQLG